MIAWEYQSVIFSSELDGNKIYLAVKEINGQDGSYQDASGSRFYSELHEFLEKNGRDGWEAVSITPLDISTSGTINASLLIFKRPLNP